jgi:hypothetical protein
MDHASRTAGERLLPRAGKGIVQAVSAAAISVDRAAGGEQSISLDTAMNGPMQAGGASVSDAQSGGGTVKAMPIINPSGNLGRWIEITADGTDMGIVSGPTSASVTGGNAPVFATNGNAGTAGVCKRLFAGTTEQFYALPDDRFLGIVGVGNGQVRIFPTGRPT